LALTSGSACAESDFDFEELMKDVETRIQNVQNNISAGDVNTAAADTKALKDSFALVEGYFAKRGDASDAVADAKNYQDKAVSIQAALTTGNASGAADAAGEFSRQCRGACHDKYKPL
jgi:cell fate (sporulation/competence/biofilm development) regulator YmcA (YheA/YmcA/DUF963 family)